MEAQVENNVKKARKQINKEKKRKKKHICTDFNHWKIAEVDKKKYWKERTYFELVPLA